MTPAITLLTKKKVSYEIVTFNHDNAAESYGLEAAEKMGMEANCVFKTLVVRDETNTLAVAVIPVENRLNYKKLAKALKCKKVEMAEPNHVVASTGYILGGVSPLGQKKRLRTVIHNSAFERNVVFVSGGKRGLELKLSAQDLKSLTSAVQANIVDD